MKKRGIKKIYVAKETIEGAGVHLKRGFGYPEIPAFDPFLLFDDFTNKDPGEYIPGFPWHPHRGIETVTYMLKGLVEHEDSMGTKGTIGPGDVQWMTAGSGIIHQEMPRETQQGIQGFQLWVNLPAKDKMMAPRYREILAKNIPHVKKVGLLVKIIAGSFEDTQGPVSDLVVNPTYFDVTLSEGKVFSHVFPEDHTIIVYVLEGELSFNTEDNLIKKGSVVLTTLGEVFECHTKNTEARFFIMGGKPLGESIAWHGPIVMNTHEELQQAFDEYRNGTFVKNTKTAL